MTREEAINEIKSWDFLKGKEIEAIHTLIPELRESDDERMRKKTINCLTMHNKGYIDAKDIDECIAWLEKQKEQKPNQSEEEREYVKTLKGLISDFIRDSGGAISDVTYYQRICDWLDERHIEQKPTEYLDKDKVYATMKKLHDLSFSQLIPINSDEYKKIDEITCDIRNFLNYPIEQKPLEKQDYSGLTDLERAIHRAFLCAGVENVPVTIIKETARECLALKPVEWLEEDEIYLQDALWCVEQATKVARDENDMGACWSAERWLKSLRPVKQEWSEEDEKNCNRIIRFLEPHKTFFPTKETKEEMQNWIKNRLKSLRPSWKPSEEQMEALAYASKVLSSALYPVVAKASEELESIREQLKKL